MTDPWLKQRTSNVSVTRPPTTPLNGTEVSPIPGGSSTVGQSTATLWQSEGHPVNRNTGKRDSGGPFYQTSVGYFVNPGHVSKIINANGSANQIYSGPVWIGIPNVDYFEEFDSDVPTSPNSSMVSDGATAISQCAPTNSTANLASTIAESMREGIPSLPGIQSWKNRTEILRNAGSEYLNYQFGWAPLQNEVTTVVNAARRHRDIMQNYRHNEGRDVHRSFEFSPEKSVESRELDPRVPVTGGLSSQFFSISPSEQSVCTITRESVRKRWFTGCFTYGGLSKTDSFGRALGFGEEADAVYGLSLSPDVLWDLTPWSWAVDWFTNTGDVIHNATNFALAGLVMRYGYMMEETINTVTLNWGDCNVFVPEKYQAGNTKFITKREGSGSVGRFAITKSRVPANPFGFGVGWEDLSPTQLAITAAIGITRLL